MRGKKIIVNQILLSELWYRGQMYAIPKYIQKKYTISSGTEKNTTSQTPSLTRSLGISDKDKNLNCIKMKWIQRLLNPTNVLWKDLMLCRLKLILNSDQGLALFRQKQILRCTSHNNLQKQNNEDFFIQLLYAWLHLTNNKFPASCLCKKFLTKPIFLNQHTRLDFSSDV